MSDSLQHLVETYLNDPTPAHREAVVLGAVPLVRSLVGKLNAPTTLMASPDDLENAGIEGLLQALDNYDPAQARFVTHAYRRVQGALIDYLRSIDVLSRGARKKIGQIQHATATLRQLLSREPSDEEVADHLGMSLDRYHVVLADAQRRFALSLSSPFQANDGRTVLDVLPAADSTAGFARVEHAHLMEQLQAAIKTLPERQQTILGLYYMEDLTLREIGDMLDLSEARISQILGKVYLTLRARLTRVCEPSSSVPLASYYAGAHSAAGLV